MPRRDAYGIFIDLKTAIANRHTRDYLYTMSNQLSEHFKAFYSDGFKIGMTVVEQAFTRESILSATHELYRNIDALIDSLLGFAENQGSPAHCAKGCAWCCYQPVYALTNEVLFLHEFIQSKFDEQRRAEIYRKAEEKKTW